MCGGLGECGNNVCNCIPGYGGSTCNICIYNIYIYI